MLQENPLLEREDGEEEPPQEYRWQGQRRTRHECARDPRRRRRRRVSGNEARRSGDSAGEARHAGADAAPTRDDLPDVTDFADYGGGGTDGDWGGGSGSPTRTTTSTPQQVATSSLRDHLIAQLALLNLPLRDRQIVAALIDALDDDGYLASSLEEIAELLSRGARDRARGTHDRAQVPAELRAGGRGRARSAPNAWRCS